MSNNFIFNYSIATNKGIREINEDASWIGFNKSEQVLIIVCDGIGSQDDSQIASLITVETFKSHFEKKTRIRNIDLFFNKCLKASYNKVSSIANKKLNGKKIGTTLVATFIDNGKVTTFNLGDSRLYHYSYADDA
jgi:protein phosphatase